MGWIGVDLDGTLAVYAGWVDELHIGEPIQPMVQRVKSWLDEGKQVKIFTARVSAPYTDLLSKERRPVDEIAKAIQDWCEKHIGVRLEVTCVKDFGMIELWDDRCVQVIPNTGIQVKEK